MQVPALAKVLRKRLDVAASGPVVWLDALGLFESITSTGEVGLEIEMVCRENVLALRLSLANVHAIERKVLYCRDPAVLEPLEEIVQCFSTLCTISVDDLLHDVGVKTDSPDVALSRQYAALLVEVWDRVGGTFWDSGKVDLGVALALHNRDRGDELDLALELLQRAAKPLPLGLGIHQDGSREVVKSLVSAILERYFGLPKGVTTEEIASSLLAHDLLSTQTGKALVGHLVERQRGDSFERCINAIVHDRRLREGLREPFERALRELKVSLEDLPVAELFRLRIAPGVDELLTERLDGIVEDAGEAGAFAVLRPFDVEIRRRGLNPYADAIAFDDAVETGRALLGEAVEVEAFFSLYATHWWEIDRLYRRIAGRVKRVLQRALETTYRVWLRDLTVRFTDSLCNLPSWKFKRSQRHLGASFEHVTGRNAIVVSDALRYEMASDLFERITKASKSLDWAIASVPTKTEVGMSALLPSDEPLRLKVVDKSLVVSVGKRITTDKSARDAAWRAAGYSVFDEVEVRSADLTSLDRVVVFHGAIDALGEKLQAQAFDHYETLLEQLARLVGDLAKRGFRVTVTADHGFLTLPPNAAGPIVAGAAEDDVKKRRYRVGAMDPLPEPAISRPASALGMEGDVVVSFPPAASVFSAHGALVFVHGGLSLQEMAIPVLVVESKSAGKGTGVLSVSFPKRLRGRIVQVTVKADEGPHEALALRLLARAARCEISATATLEPGERSVRFSPVLPADTPDGDVELIVMVDGGRVIERKVVEYESHE